ncbi:MAG TPA: MFS transporter [Bauldia sp.]|nr:MFS transporter [Bauldia sp.]
MKTIAAASAGAGIASVPRSAIVGWILFDAASQPFFTLVTTFVFAPYFAAHLAATPVEGQALWGYAVGIAGVIIAIFSPVLGSIADATGPRKPWIAVFSLLLVLGSAALWFAGPQNPQAIPLALVAFGIATIGAEFAAVFNNSMMPDLVPASQIGRLSGAGWAVGYVGGLVSLLVVLGLLASVPGTGETYFGLPPLFGLDPSTFEGTRAVGPFTALWCVALIWPLFLFTPDAPHRMKLRLAVRKGLSELRQTLMRLGDHSNATRFLIANMTYTDGLIALTVFGGIYAAGTFSWSATEMGVFGIVLTVTGTIGALVGGKLDDTFGPKAVLFGAITLLTVAAIGILSVDADHVAWIIPVSPPVAGDGLFSSTPERAYIALGGLIGAAAGPLWAASRSLLCRVAPRDHMTQFFGLFALAGKATSFVGPLLVAGVTSLSGNQRIGISVLILFFIVGGAVLAGVKSERPDA